MSLRPSPHAPRPLLLALSSAALLIVSFPNFNQSWCAWIALVPWLLLLRRTSTRAAFWWSCSIGAGFILASMWWLTKVTVVGHLVSSAYLGLYFGVFGVAARWAMARESIPLVRWLVVACAWVAAEFARSHLLTGQPWNLLGYALAGWLPLVQIADLTGTWGISWLIVMGNLALADALSAARDPAGRQAVGRAAVVVLLLVGAAAVYGWWRMPQVTTDERVRLALVQGNIPQEEKWEEAFEERILQQYERLTREAAAGTPALIVWPETSVPGYVGADEILTQRILALALQVGTPLLVGAPVPTLDGYRVSLRNSAVLVEPRGDLRMRYDKVHLVPFGEFVPFEQAMPWLRALLPPIGTFSPGHGRT